MRQKVSMPLLLFVATAAVVTLLLVYAPINVHVSIDTPRDDSANNTSLNEREAEAATRTGTESDDTLNGTRYRDYLNGYGGSDTLNGGSGDDIIVGGEGDDELYGDDGKDNIRTEGGVDTVYSGSGDDVIMAKDNDADTIDCGGGSGDFVFVDSGGIDTLTNCENVSEEWFVIHG